MSAKGAADHGEGMWTWRRRVLIGTTPREWSAAYRKIHISKGKESNREGGMESFQDKVTENGQRIMGGQARVIDIHPQDEGMKRMYSRF